MKAEVEEFLQQSFDKPNNDYYSDFNNAGSLHVDKLTTTLRGGDPDSMEFRIEHFAKNLDAKIEALRILNRKTRFIHEATASPEHSTNESNTDIQTTMKSIFISHSKKDIEYVDVLIDILEAIGVPSGKIFCTSFEGYGIPLGNDFLQTI